MDDIEVGDHVYVGEEGRVHWIVTELFSSGVGVPHAKLKSGMTGYRKIIPVKNLRLHSKGRKDAGA